MFSFVFNERKRSVSGVGPGPRASRTERPVGLSPPVDKEEPCPMSEAWDVDQGLITKLKEQYRKERKGKKGVKSKSTRAAPSPPSLTSSTGLETKEKEN